MLPAMLAGGRKLPERLPKPCSEAMGPVVMAVEAEGRSREVALPPAPVPSPSSAPLPEMALELRAGAAEAEGAAVVAALVLGLCTVAAVEVLGVGPVLPAAEVRVLGCWAWGGALGSAAALVLEGGLVVVLPLLLLPPPANEHVRHDR
eukprot:1025052-Pelagomonas_calceolata.AAC.5